MVVKLKKPLVFNKKAAEAAFFALESKKLYQFLFL
jgi:hypothetical protein